MLCVLKHQETKEIDTEQLDTSKLHCCFIFRKLFQYKFSVMEYLFWVIEGKITVNVW